MRGAPQALWLGVIAAAATVVVSRPGVAASRSNVSIRDLQFDPRELTVEVGEEVTWTNKDPGQVHSVTAEDGSFDSSPDCSDATPGSCLDDRDSFSHTFSREGRFPYYSRTNGGPGGQGTSGVVEVVAPGTPRTTTTAPPADPAGNPA